MDKPPRLFSICRQFHGHALHTSLVLLFIFIPLLLTAQETVTPLSSIREIRALNRESAARALPVRVSGVVTFASPNTGGSFIIDDGNTGIYVSTPDIVARGLPKPISNVAGDIKLGMRVEVTGVTSPGGFAPVILPRQIEYIGTSTLPPAKLVSVADLQTGRFDCERVRVRGVIQHVAFTERQIDAARLELAAVGGHFVAYALNPQGFAPAKLVDAEVELAGVALSFFNERAELVGTRVQLQGIEDVEIVTSAPENPFAAPEARLDALLPFTPDPPSLHRRLIRGTVTVCRPGSYFYVQEGERAVRVSTRDPAPLTPGDQVEVSGFIELWEYFAEVREGIVRKVGAAPVPTAEAITRSAVLAAKPWMGPSRTASHLDGRRVVLQGVLEKIEGSDSTGRRLSLDCEGHVVFATLANDEPRRALERLVPGSEVSVTGVCQIQLSVGRPTLSNPVPTGFQLLVHSPEDVAVLRVPPWWTPRRLWLALGSTAAILALALAWAWLLRRRVTQRTAELAAEMGARRNAAVEFEATLRERKRLAADLHDTLEQALMGLALQLEAVDLFRNNEPERSTHHLHLARQFLARSREDVRRSVWNLRAQGLEGRTLTEALREMITGLADGQTVSATCKFEGTPVPLPDFVAGNLLLLAQEAVTNALKHGKPGAVSVHVVFASDRVSLRIIDDGKGFDPEHAPGLKEGHFGLQGMRERVKRLGGTLEIFTRINQGTSISATVPTHAFDVAMES